MAHQLAAQQHAQNDRANRQPLNPAVGFDQLRGRQQFGQNAVFGGRVSRCTQAHHGVSQQRMGAKQHEQAAPHLDEIAHQHDASLGHGVGIRPNKRRQHHVKQGKHGHQGSLLPFRSVAGAQQLHGGYKQGVVGQRAEKLRCHDGKKAAFHQ